MGFQDERLNAYGVSAATIMALHGRPMFGASYLRFDGRHLVVVGSHLPPNGDPDALGVAFGPGVAYSFDYPLASPEWGSHYWYWPNSDYSTFELTIDLPASSADADPFHFWFTTPADMPLGAVPATAFTFGTPHGHVWIPPHLDSFIGYPADSTQLTRVQTWSTSQTVTFSGYSAFRSMEALLLRYGVQRRSGLRVLDWGCGHGRVARHFIQNWPEARVTGLDIDAENIAWCQANLPSGQFTTAPLRPPTSLADSSFDAIFSISVMTHLTPEVQLLWLEELARILKPGGIAAISFGGPGSVAFSSFWHAHDYLDEWRSEGIHSSQIDLALSGKVAEADYYRNTAQTYEYTVANWSKHFDILAIAPEALGYLDFAILRLKEQNVLF